MRDGHGALAYRPPPVAARFGSDPGIGSKDRAQPSASDYGRQGVESLVTEIKRISRDDLVLILYACSTASSNQNSFAALLRDLLSSGDDPKPRCRVVGHTRVAHAYHTPFIRVFEGPAGAGGTDIYSATPAQRARFRRYLVDTAFKWAFPFMSVDSINAFLDADPGTDTYQESPVG